MLVLAVPPYSLDACVPVCVPYPQSWVFGALTFERRAALYGIYAALYSSPLLLRGLDWQDPWVLGVLALGVVHVQVGMHVLLVHCVVKLDIDHVPGGCCHALWRVGANNEKQSCYRGC